MATAATILAPGLGAFLHSLLGDRFPPWWDGFNACMAPVPNAPRPGMVVLSVRCATTQAMRRSGVASMPLGLHDTPQHRALVWVRVPQDLSAGFMWGDWRLDDFTAVLVGSYESATGRFRPDADYSPYFSFECRSRFVPAPPGSEVAKQVPGWIQFRKLEVPCQDVRLFLGEDGELVMHDAYTLFMRRLRVDHARKAITLVEWLPSVCLAAARSPADEDYVKHFDKNWSYVGQSPDGGRLLFLDWFYPDGVYGVWVPTASGRMGRCQKALLVPFRGDALPREGDARLPAFSFGSTTLRVGGGKAPMDALGVGHVKFSWTHMLAPQSPLYAQMAQLDQRMAARYGARYKRHYKSAYAWFWFRFSSKAGGKYGMTISDLWVPELADEGRPYHSLISFPVGLMRDGPDTLVLSGGLSDYYCFSMRVPVKEALALAGAHDVEKMNIAQLSLKAGGTNQTGL